LTTAYNHCLTGAAKIPNSSQRAAVTQQCKTAYAAAKQALASGGKAMKDARAACEASAKQIPNGTQRQQAEAGCAKIPQ
jgi:hypothetical protein